jgi:hypothetical protein
MDTNSEDSKPELSPQDAGAQVAEAHGLLKKMREQLEGRPDLDLAIEKLEMALSILTTNTGGML